MTARLKKVRQENIESIGRIRIYSSVLNINQNENMYSQLLSNSTVANSDRLRICVGCRQKKPRSSLLCLTVDHTSNVVALSGKGSSLKAAIHGRSAYICALKSCLDQALKGTRLKAALEGRKIKGNEKKRSISWPLDPQLIHDMSLRCTDTAQTCKNTQEKEGGE